MKALFGLAICSFSLCGCLGISTVVRSASPVEENQPGVAVIDAGPSTGNANIQLAGGPIAAPHCPPGGFYPRHPAIHFTPAEARIPFEDLQETYPDEYLCDGGDRALPVHYDNLFRRGLDTEDTVAEFVDDLGERHVKPTNSVCIYSPRFAAVRVLSSTSDGSTVVRHSGMGTHRGGYEVGVNIAAIDRTKNDSATKFRMRKGPGGFDGDTAPGAALQATTRKQNDQFAAAVLNLHFLKYGVLKTGERPVLAKAILAATRMSQRQFPVAMATVDQSQQIRAHAQAAEKVGFDIKDKTKGKLRIVKAADKTAAKPGDVITFTIRVDNLGQRPLYHVQVLDNLTPRFAFIPGSVKSDLDIKTEVEDNGEGGMLPDPDRKLKPEDQDLVERTLLLKFKLTKPLVGKTGGRISFQVRVR